ncbi:unnamed protein product [Brassicogethes aeneus]|uniref:Phosphodiesterase n=1 Tax=Brassicogethes aeneus TaxID=1431903 RepID=A0A9P0B7K2_BRAAE|nr:unnamed protein product [Brassicogethes aeneus]
MEPFTNYKLAKEKQDNLYIPPPYCKEDVEKTEPPHEDNTPMPKLEVSNPGKLLNLIAALTNNSTKLLEYKLNLYLKGETEARQVFLINLLSVSEEAVVQVITDKILDKPMRTPLSEDAINNIVEYKNDLVQCSERLDPKISGLLDDILIDKKGQKVVLVPVLSVGRKRYYCPGQSEIMPVYLVAFLEPERETEYITKLVNETFKYCNTLLLNTREMEEEARLKKQCQSLLSVARKLFSHLGDLSDLLKEIMSEARRLTNAERCSLFLLDPDHMHLVAKVFDGVSPADKNTEVRIAKDQGIAGHVAVSGQLLNIKNAYKHPLFYKGMDEATGFKTRNILCFPIRDEDNIVGVAQLCNKMGGNFDYFDEQVADAFSIYCGISIMHSLVYKRIQDAQARSKLSNELMIYHMHVSEQNVADLVLCDSPHIHPDFGLFSFTPRKIIFNETPCYVLKMFEDLGFVNEFMIKREVLARFILYVKKGYRDVPYHNWMHAFSVAHFAYLCLKNFQLVENKYFSNLEAMAYFIACLCHDIDHRGTTNSFQQQSNSVLASLYSSEGSVMERHHVSQTLCILNTEGCNFLESLNHEDYSRCLDLINHMILATDLASHYKIHNKQLIMATEGYHPKDPEHRYILACLLMTCADLSDQTKDWIETKRVAQLIYAEFFAQGDLEKKMGKEPANMMDREKASIPDHQLVFLKDCVICIFKLLANMFPKSKVMIETIKRNILCWEAAKIIFDKKALEGKTSYEVLSSNELDTEVESFLKETSSPKTEFY